MAAPRNETKAIVATVALGFVAIVVIARLTNRPGASDATAPSSDAAAAPAPADAADAAIDAGAEP